MDRRSAEMETVPHSLGAIPSRTKGPSDGRSFTEIVADFFRKNGQADNVQAAPTTRVSPAAAPTQETPPGAEIAPNPLLLKHWNAIRADGISASQFIAFLQPLANLDGITVSYSYSDEDGKEQVYNRRQEEAKVPRANPLSEAIRKGKVSKEKALTFALNEEGRVWIESNFTELK